MQQKTEHIYTEIEAATQADVETTLRENDPEQLKRLVLAVALHGGHQGYAEDLCVRLSSHADEQVRGNALLGLGHIARIFKVLSDRAKPLIESGLSEPSAYVRGQAWAAADDAEHYLGWKLNRS